MSTTTDTAAAATEIVVRHYVNGWNASQRDGHDLERDEDRYIAKHGREGWRSWMSGWSDYSCDETFGAHLADVVGEVRSSSYIDGHGTYSYALDLLAAQLLRDRSALLAEVIDRCADAREPGMHAADYRKLRKIELAAMLADFETGARDNERECERIAAERNASVDSSTLSAAQVAALPNPFAEVVTVADVASADARLAIEVVSIPDTETRLARIEGIGEGILLMQTEDLSSVKRYSISPWLRNGRPLYKLISTHETCAQALRAIADEFDAEVAL